jgi:hypothetical protein
LSRTSVADPCGSAGRHRDNPEKVRAKELRHRDSAKRGSGARRDAMFTAGDLAA